MLLENQNFHLFDWLKAEYRRGEVVSLLRKNKCTGCDVWKNGSEGRGFPETCLHLKLL